MFRLCNKRLYSAKTSDSSGLRVVVVWFVEEDVVVLVVGSVEMVVVAMATELVIG